MNLNINKINKLLAYLEEKQPLEYHKFVYLFGKAALNTLMHKLEEETDIDSEFKDLYEMLKISCKHLFTTNDEELQKMLEELDE